MSISFNRAVPAPPGPQYTEFVACECCGYVLPRVGDVVVFGDLAFTVAEMTKLHRGPGCRSPKFKLHPSLNSALGRD